MRLQMEKNSGRCERDKRETTNTLTRKKKKDTKRESRRVNNFKRLRTSAGTRVAGKKKEKERERDVEERFRRTREMEKAFWKRELFLQF